MEPLSSNQRFAVLEAANTWWRPGSSSMATLPRPRPFLRSLLEGLAQSGAIWLYGPRGAGKSMLLLQAAAHLLSNGLPPANLCYVPLDHPALSQMDLEEIIAGWYQLVGEPRREVPCFLFLDEPARLPQSWQDLPPLQIDGHQRVVVVCSCLAPTLREANSKEGAVMRGLYLPPLTFPEYLANLEDPFGPRHENDEIRVTPELVANLTASFESYLDLGGFPQGSQAASRYLANAVAAILPRPELCATQGIASRGDLSELLLLLANACSTRIAPESLVRLTGMAKNTSRKYMEFLEASHLIRIVHPINEWAVRLRRARSFRTFLIHPCLYRIFLGSNDLQTKLTRLAEAATLVQLPPSRSGLVEHAWNESSLGLVHLSQKRRVSWAMEVTYHDEGEEPEALVTFCRRHHLKGAIITTRSIFERTELNDVVIHRIPLALQCYALGYRQAWRRGIKLIM